MCAHVLPTDTKTQYSLSGDNIVLFMLCTKQFLGFEQVYDDIYKSSQQSLAQKGLKRIDIRCGRDRFCDIDIYLLSAMSHCLVPGTNVFNIRKMYIQNVRMSFLVKMYLFLLSLQ